MQRLPRNFVRRLFLVTATATVAAVCLSAAAGQARGVVGPESAAMPRSTDEVVDPDHAADRLVATLQLTSWSVQVLSHRLQGNGCWLQSPEGFVRLEISQHAPSRLGGTDRASVSGSGRTTSREVLAPLLRQQGDGWSVVLGADRTGTINRWQREWQRAPVSLVEALRAVLSALHDGPPADFSVGGAMNARRLARRPGQGPTGHRLEISPLVLPGTTEPPRTEPVETERAESRRTTVWRSKMVDRGTGRGSAGEIITLDWRREPLPVAAAATTLLVRTTLEVHSSRRLGVLRLEPLAQVPEVSCLVPELFTPLWPLGDLVVFPH